MKTKSNTEGKNNQSIIDYKRCSVDEPWLVFKWVSLLFEQVFLLCRVVRCWKTRLFRVHILVWCSLHDESFQFLRMKSVLSKFFLFLSASSSFESAHDISDMVWGQCGKHVYLLVVLLSLNAYHHPTNHNDESIIDVFNLFVSLAADKMKCWKSDIIRLKFSILRNGNKQSRVNFTCSISLV